MIQYFIVLSLFITGASFAQPCVKLPQFTDQQKLARWLVVYDAVAWSTSDSVMTASEDELKKIGVEWFCYEDTNNAWHAVYGKLNEDTYNVVFHYYLDSTNIIRRISSPVDPEMATAFARALDIARDEMAKQTSDSSIVFNQYLRREGDGSIYVWMFPAFAKDATAVYGGEGTFHMDASGKKIISKDTYFQKNFRGFKPDRNKEIYLDYSDLKYPTLGAVFFVWYYKEYFKEIFIENKSCRHTVLPMTDKGDYTWLSIERKK